MQPYLGNILREIDRECKWRAADRGPRAAADLLRAVIVHANELLRDCMDERCFICGLDLDDDNSYGSDEFPLCRQHHGAVEMLVAFMAAGGTAEDAGRKIREIEAELEKTDAT